MTNFLVRFPGLGLELNIDRVVFSVGDFNVYWYGLIIASGMMLAITFAMAKAKTFGLDQDRMIDVILVGMVMSVVCARAYYVAFAPFEYESLAQMVNLRDGGLAIYGSVIGAFVFGGLACKWRKVPLFAMADVASMGFLIGQAIGRWGNFMNQEAFGSNTSLPWGMISERTTAYLTSVQASLAAQGIMVDPAMPVHPTFLYESLWCAAGFFLLLWYHKRRRFDGELLLLYIIWYGAGRAVIEGLRTDSLYIGPFRMSQLLAVLSLLAAAAVLFWLRARWKKAPWPLAVQTAAASAAPVQQEEQAAACERETETVNEEKEE